MSRMCELSAAATVYVLIVLLPLYGALSVYYGTHSFEYAWSVSGTFVSGPVPFVLMLLAYLALVLCVVWWFQRILSDTRECILHRPSAIRSSWTLTSGEAVVTVNSKCVAGLCTSRSR